MSPRPLKVWGIATPLGGNANGQVRAIVATTSMAAAANAIGWPTSTFRNHAMDTENPVELAVALSEPGTVFFCDNDHHVPDAAGYIRWEPPTKGADR